MNIQYTQIAFLVLAAISSSVATEEFPTPCHNSEHGYEQCLLNLENFQVRFRRPPLSDNELKSVYGCLASSQPSGMIFDDFWQELPECQVNLPQNKPEGKKAD